MDVLRLCWLLSTGLGAASSIALVLIAGRWNESHLLIAMFAVWVTLPFVGIAALEQLLQRASAKARAAFYLGTMTLVAASILAYSVVTFGPPRPKPARVFLLMPGTSLVGTAVVSARLRTRAVREPATGEWLSAP